jgi:CRISPR/Cas system-associated exonuclease Cas4 (RecB family)
VAHYLEADFEGAVSLLGQAYARATEPLLRAKIQLYLGVNHALLGDQTAAQLAFRQALQHDPSLTVPNERFKSSVLELFRRVRAALRGELVVTLEGPVAVEVRVGGEKVGVAPLRVQLPIGEHGVLLRNAEGTYQERHRVIVAPDATVELVATPPAEARLAIDSTPPGAEVLLDGQPIGVTPLRDVRLAAGEHALTLRREGHRSHAMRVSLAAGAERQLEISLDSLTSHLRPWTWVTAACAVASLGVAVGFGLGAQADYEEWQEQRGLGTREQWEELREMGQAKQRVANVMFGVSGGLVVGAAVLYLIGLRAGPESRQGAAARLAPLFGQTTGLAIQGAF